MVVVAVAGGTGGVGKTIVRQLEVNGKHKVVVLSRKTAAGATSGTGNASREVLVDYNNIDALSAILEEHNVDTVISTINLRAPTANNSQLNLIKAAGKSTKTRRFVLSEFTAFLITPE